MVLLGIPSFEECVSIYSRCRGILTALPSFNFFLALSYFKIASIAQVISVVLNVYIYFQLEIILTLSPKNVAEAFCK